jgi:CTP:molybdopterin cytidylyltransferase MocA
MNLPDDEGARKLIQRHKNDTILVPLKGGEIDIDTIEAYEKLM